MRPSKAGPAGLEAATMRAPSVATISVLVPMSMSRLEPGAEPKSVATRSAATSPPRRSPPHRPRHGRWPSRSPGRRRRRRAARPRSTWTRTDAATPDSTAATRGDVEVRVAEDGALTIPDFNGNLFFATLGNIVLNGKAGLLFVDFETGDMLQMTGEAEVAGGGFFYDYQRQVMIVTSSLEETTVRVAPE